MQNWRQMKTDPNRTWGNRSAVLLSFLMTVSMIDTHRERCHGEATCFIRFSIGTSQQLMSIRRSLAVPLIENQARWRTWCVQSSPTSSLRCFLLEQSANGISQLSDGWGLEAELADAGSWWMPLPKASFRPAMWCLLASNDCVVGCNDAVVLWRGSDCWLPGQL